MSFGMMYAICLFLFFFSLSINSSGVHCVQNDTLQSTIQQPQGSPTESPVTTTPVPLVATEKIIKVHVNNTFQNSSEEIEPLVGEAKEKEAPGPLFSFPYFGNTHAIGDKCEKTEDCKIPEAFCLEGTCQCSSEYVASSNRRGCLFKAKKLLDNCMANEQCEVGLNATGVVACVGFKCICSLGAYVVQDKCYKKLYLGNKCQNNEECSVPFSACIQNVCACIDNMEPDEDDSKCIVMKSMDSLYTNCTDDHSCSRFGELYRCKEGICVCKAGYHFSGIECVEEKRLGDFCERSSDCIVDEMREKSGIRECRNKVCSCVDGYKTDRTINICKGGAASMTSNLTCLVLFLFILCFKGQYST